MINTVKLRTMRAIQAKTLDISTGPLGAVYVPGDMDADDRELASAQLYNLNTEHFWRTTEAVTLASEIEDGTTLLCNVCTGPRCHGEVIASLAQFVTREAERGTQAAVRAASLQPANAKDDSYFQRRAITNVVGEEDEPIVNFAQAEDVELETFDGEPIAQNETERTMPVPTVRRTRSRKAPEAQLLAQ